MYVGFAYCRYEQEPQPLGRPSSLDTSTGVSESMLSYIELYDWSTSVMTVSPVHALSAAEHVPALSMPPGGMVIHSHTTDVVLSARENAGQAPEPGDGGGDDARTPCVTAYSVNVYDIKRRTSAI